MKVRCSRCDKEHEIDGDVEPAFGLPDAVFALTERQRHKRVRLAKDFCWDTETDLHYLRTLLVIRVEGRLRPIRWGIWVQVENDIFHRVLEYWDHPGRLTLWPMAGVLANTIPTMDPTLGLPETMGFRNLTDVTYLTLSPGEHPLIRHQQEGIPSALALEWLITHAGVHDAPAITS